MRALLALDQLLPFYYGTLKIRNIITLKDKWTEIAVQLFTVTYRADLQKVIYFMTLIN